MGQRNRTYGAQKIKPFIKHGLNLVKSATSPNWVFGPKAVLKSTLSPREEVGAKPRKQSQKPVHYALADENDSL